MTNPRGLSKDGTTLFICDGKDGLKVYDARDNANLLLLEHLQGFESYDIICQNKLAIVVTKDGLVQYSYADPAHLKLLSSKGWD